VSLIHGEDRRKNVFEALMAVDDQIRPKLVGKTYAVIKPNIVSTTNQLAATHADALRGILDYLAPRLRGPVVIAESSAGETLEGYENFGYAAVAAEYKEQNVSLVDLNQEGEYELLPLVDYDLHVAPVRLAARMLDPEAFVVCAAMPKTHNVTIVTAAIKNMVMGAPLHQAPGESTGWNDKRRYHVGLRQSLYNMFLTAQKLQPNWGVAVIDGYEGMEGNGPERGTAVPSRIAIASTDFVAAERVVAEAMGVNPDWLALPKYCTELGLGQWDLSRIDVEGTAIADIARQYKLHQDIQELLRWQGPMEELPQNYGWTHPTRDEAYT